MPVFLDRHDFFRVTATDIARIFQEDLRVQQEFGCWVLAYWFDQKRKTTFCLVDAPDVETVREMHCYVHHSYPNQIIQVEEDIIESFLRCIEGVKSPYNPQSLFFQKPNFSAVMVMKIDCSYSSKTKEYSKSERIFEDFKHCSQKLIKKNKGRMIKSACDGCIYSFDSVSRSIKSALQIQQELSVRINNKREKTIMLSIGIDGGRPMHEHCDLFEETKNLAGRLCCIAGNNQIVVSAKVKEQIQLKNLGTLAKNGNLKSLSYKDEQFFSRLMDIIELNYKEDLKIGDFCKIMGESRSQLYRKIIEVTNLPPVVLINEYRLKRAAELMSLQKGSNVSQIAFEAGFNSLSYFSKRFKKRFGHLPSAYMNRSY